jgi:hypothetical protein
MERIALSFFHAVISCVFAISLYQFLRILGEDFQYPIIRSPLKRSGPTIALPSGVAILVFYFLIGYLVFFGLAKPLMPGTNIMLNSFDFAVIGVMMVGLIRMLTIMSSISTYRTLQLGLVLSCGLVSYITLQSPSIVNNAVIQATTNSITNQRDYIPLMIIPVEAFVIAILAELIWWINVRLTKKQLVPIGFNKALKEELQSEEIGYTHTKIQEAYIKAIEDVTSTEKIWEICWVSSGNTQTDKIYTNLIDNVAARIAVEKGALLAYSGFNSLTEEDIKIYRKKARNHLEKNGMFLMYQGAKEGIARFTKNMGFSPTLLSSYPITRFMIINRRVLITSWPAHPPRYAFGSNIIFRATMYSRPEDAPQINNYLDLFESLWGQHQMTKNGGVLARLPKECHEVLAVINDREGIWTINQLATECQEREYKYSLEQLKSAVDFLISNKLIIATGSDSFSRDRNLYEWQNRCLYINRLNNTQD